MKYIIALEIEPKDTPQVDAEFPTSRAVATRLQDVLRDATKHDETIGWMVTKVQLFTESIGNVVL